MKKVISTTALVVASLTQLIGATSTEVNEVVNQTSNPEVVHFLAPIIAGLLAKLMDLMFRKKGGKDA